MTGVGPTAVPAAQQTLRCRTVASGGYRHMSYVRNLPPIPVEERLGLPTDESVATPSETLLAALGSCLAARIYADAVTGSIAVRSLELEMEADVDKSPMWGMAGANAKLVGFGAIRVMVHLDADAPAEALRALIAHAVLWSPIANTIHNPVHLDVALGTVAEAGADTHAEPRG